MNAPAFTCQADVKILCSTHSHPGPQVSAQQYALVESARRQPRASLLTVVHTAIEKAGTVFQLHIALTWTGSAPRGAPNPSTWFGEQV